MVQKAQYDEVVRQRDEARAALSSALHGGAQNITHDEAVRQLGEARARIATLEAALPSERAKRDAAEGMIDEDPEEGPTEEELLACFKSLAGIGPDLERLADATTRVMSAAERIASALEADGALGDIATALEKLAAAK